MLKNNRTEQTSISNHLTKSYLMLFPIFILSFFLVVVIGTVVSSGWLQGSNIMPGFRAETLIRSEIEKIDVSDVIISDGGAAVIFDDGRVQELGGRRLFVESTLSKTEWTGFLTRVSDPAGKYVYSVSYNEKDGFWLVVGFPVSVRIRLSVASNAEAEGYTKARILYLSAILVLMLLLFFVAWIYAKYSSKTFIAPLRKLCGMVKRVARGEYEMDENEVLSGEFLWLKNDIYKLSAELSREKILRENLENDKKQMLLDISHDLRNPLATIMGYAEMLSASESQDDEKRIRYANVIFKNSIRANHLMNDMFTYTKLDHAGFKPTLEQQDICEFMREQASQFLPEFEASGIDTEFEIPETEISMQFDGNLLQRAFYNLFSNCMNHNPAGTKLALSLTEEKDTVQIVIADNGIGMEESVATKVFDPFVRSDKSRNSKTGGSGLGLAITLKIIRMHNGSIELDTAPGKGSRFVVTLKKS